ncbi:hypothetical protein F5X99DRAFT_429938 [Biscogniauxia marginata]|nr:hypothetical protein F5X99DRAFT_429938 [Biscogniauxia marginata]
MSSNASNVIVDVISDSISHRASIEEERIRRSSKEKMARATRDLAIEIQAEYETRLRAKLDEIKKQMEEELHKARRESQREQQEVQNLDDELKNGMRGGNGQTTVSWLELGSVVLKEYLDGMVQDDNAQSEKRSGSRDTAGSSGKVDENLGSKGPRGLGPDFSSDVPEARPLESEYPPLFPCLFPHHNPPHNPVHCYISYLFVPPHQATSSYYKPKLTHRQSATAERHQTQGRRRNTDETATVSASMGDIDEEIPARRRSRSHARSSSPASARSPALSSSVETTPRRPSPPRAGDSSSGNNSSQAVPTTNVHSASAPPPSS